MSLSIFQKDSILNYLHSEAQRHDEWAANRFILRYCSKYIFYEDKWIIGTEVPPKEDHCQLRMDLSIQQFNASRRALVFRLIGQAKKGKSGPKKISEVEGQAIQLSQVHLLNPMWRDGIQAVWVLTYYGTNFRIWVCRREDRELDPFYPLDGEAGDKKAYRDVKEYEQDFNWAFEYVKSMDPPDHEGIRALWNIQAPASHRAAGPFERHTSDQAISGHSGNPGLKVSECEFDNIHVLKVSADLTTCKAEDGSEFRVRRENWCKATLVKKDGSEYEGYIAKLSKNNFYTYGNPILITEERDKSKTKGKGKAH
ncbi:uncharacterized protein BBA_09808 [Beauveria bassiana ARSEF 2860]|uniref:Uncharacterized protein n=1 Tax=Beauveria bassiana (strain ARSEF 2860) TaxID=655819 RepID=J5JBB4_BEAB2|nr:uncharacterized protein BBA_09808 [Beauveria bassiana ARSEF 2860]EJP61231.1 hypothetical protein BBA_09808 [Beauveria bassiana ARSEF 2860]